MIGQDAVRSPAISQRLAHGVILTKLDGDARGGAGSPSAKSTGAPVKVRRLAKNTTPRRFLSERIRLRVLGMGDLMSLIEKVEQTVDKKAAAELERKLRKEESRSRFPRSAQEIRKMGPLEKIVDMLPKMGPLQNLPKDAKVDEASSRASKPSSTP